jgi:hypothetical protein
MPKRRQVKKGSFGSHFDEVVKHFPHEETTKRDEAHDRRKRSKDDGNVHDKLLEIASRKTRGIQSSSFSNQ